MGDQLTERGTGSAVRNNDHFLPSLIHALLKGSLRMLPSFSATMLFFLFDLFLPFSKHLQLNAGAPGVGACELLCSSSLCHGKSSLVTMPCVPLLVHFRAVFNTLESRVQVRISLLLHLTPVHWTPKCKVQYGIYCDIRPQ